MTVMLSELGTDKSTKYRAEQGFEGRKGPGQKQGKGRSLGIGMIIACRERR